MRTLLDVMSGTADNSCYCKYTVTSEHLSTDQWKNTAYGRPVESRCVRAVGLAPCHVPDHSVDQTAVVPAVRADHTFVVGRKLAQDQGQGHHSFRGMRDDSPDRGSP